MRLTKTALVIAGTLLTGTAVASLPGKPTLGWGEYVYSLIEIDPSAVAYNQLISAKRDSVNVDVSWDVWSGGAADTATILLNDEVVWQGPGSAKSASFTVDKGGKYDMVLELCNASGCVLSDPKEVTVADTDGSHMGKLETIFTENNKPFENTTGKIVGTYFVEWGVYGREYPVDKMPSANLNRIIYGFIPICGGDGLNDSVKSIGNSFKALQDACAGRKDFQVAIHDPWAAIQKPQTAVEELKAWSTPYKGNFGALMMMKNANPHVKVLPSIGGWTLSDPFFFMHDATKRKVFIDSVEDFLETWKFFDGVDIDWEFPGGGGANPSLGAENDGELYVTLMRELRAMLDKLGEKYERYYELTSAISVGADKIAKVPYGEAVKYMDNIYLMAYDYYGAWSNTELNHQSGLHSSSVNPMPDGYWSSKGIDLMLAQGVPAEKLVLGVGAYGRGWTNVTNYVAGNPFTGVGGGPIKGTWENGVLDYRDIVDNHMGSEWTRGYDEEAEAPYLFNSSTGDLISYDDTRSVIAKAKYVMDHNLGGIFHWEMDADNGDLVNAMHEGLGHNEGSGSGSGGSGGSGGGEVAPPPPVVVPNKAPVANAGQARSVMGPTSATLNGSQSKDPEGENITYNWTQTGGPKVTLSGQTQSNATIQVPAVNALTPYTFTLTVTDPEGLASTDTVVINNEASKPEVSNTAPTVSMPQTMLVDETKQVTVRATASDKEGDELTYQWTINPQVKILSGAGTNAIVIEAPSVTEDQSFPVTVVVSDGEYQMSSQGTLQVKNTDLPPTSGGGSGGAGACKTTDASASNYPAWDASTVYTSETVNYNGLVYQANWWNQGDAPSPSNETWTLKSTVDLPWNPGVAYDGNAEVNHNGSRYKAKWWTKGDTPGSADVWVKVGDATCN